MTAATTHPPDAAAEPALVGNDAARAVLGYSSAADVVLLGGLDTGGAPGSPTASSAGSSDASAGSAGAGLQPVGEVLRLLGCGAPRALGPGPSGAQLDLAALADVAGSGRLTPLVVAAADLETSVPALLDLLDKPGVDTAVATALPLTLESGAERLAPARVGGDGRFVESVGTGYHSVTRPDRVLMGVLRVAPADRGAAATAWRAAGAVHLPGDADPFALAVLALVRAGVPVQAAPLGPFGWARAGVAARGATGGPWRQRLRGSSRGGDGLVSTLMTRRLSRPLTGFGLRHGWSPDAVTVASLSTGVAAALLVATGQRWAWILAAVLLQVALVVDCVDGEIARFTRRFSAFGAWLDAVGDRVKEYAVLAAVAAVAVRRDGSDGWLLAILAMALVSMRHLEDFPYAERQRPLRASRPDLLPLSRARDDGPAGAPTTLPGAPGARARLVLAAKQLLHLPIAERYLLICLGLLTFDPRLLLWALIAAVLVAAAYTQGGRVVRALRGGDGWAPPGDSFEDSPKTEPRLPHRPRWGSLDHQLDLGPLARAAGRRLRLPVLVAVPAVLVLGGSVLLDLRVPGRAAASVGVLLAVLAAVLLGAAARPPVRHRLAWHLPVALWLTEVAVVCGVAAAHLPADRRGPAYAFAAAVAYHRYDIVYRLRDTGSAPAAELTLFGLGCDGRIVVLLAVAAWAPAALGPVLAVGAAYLAVLYLAESVRGWRRGTGHQAPDGPAAAP